MNLSGPFIRRPVATTLLSLGLVLAGLAALRMLAVSPLPQVDFPTIVVSASMPGAAPETMAATVATPLERQLGRIGGVNEMTSSSSQGSARIILQFDLSRDIDGAARDVQAAINAARVDLPANMPSNPNYRKVNPADAPVLILSLTSDILDKGQIYDAASNILVPTLSQISGVGQVSVSGASSPAVRVELNPRALAHYGIGLSEVRTAITSSNSNRPKGLVESSDRRWQIYANDQMTRAAEYRPLVVAYRNGAPVRLSDVAEVLDSVQDLRNAGSSNGKPSVLVQINRAPGANIIETVDRVRQLLPELQGALPASIDVRILMDRTTTIRASIVDLGHTLAIAIVLVILVVFAFLREPRAALIPSVAVLISLIGTFSAMYLLGYSLNILSLMALTVATGFVVDDAIVVLENVIRHVENGVKPAKAALLGAREVGFTVLAMSLSLIAVFIPILMMGGITGRLFREFAVTLSFAILVSLVVSLTTTPMMCAQLLRRTEPRQQGRLARSGQWLFDRTLRGYEITLGWALRHGWLMLLMLLATIGLNVYLYTIVPKSLAPQQDTGRLSGFIVGGQGISFQAMQQKLGVYLDIVRQDPAVAEVAGFTGGGQRNSGSMFIDLKPLSERKESAEQVIARLRPKLQAVPGASAYLMAQQDLRIGGRQGNASYQYTLLGDDLAELRKWGPRVVEALGTLPELADVSSDQQDRGLQVSLDIDRTAAARLGVTPRMLDQTLYDAFGQRQVSTIFTPINQYRVVMEVAPQYWQTPEGLNDIRVKTASGTTVPLSAFTKVTETPAALSVNHQSQFAATTFSFNLAPGYALSDAVRAIDETMSRIGVPVSIHGGFQGTARSYQQSLANQPWLILGALVTMYLVLGILYESYIHPLTILSTLPSAGVGAILALLLTGYEFSLIALIGVFLLIGIVKKNAIMMIDFALVAERERGMSPDDAITQACLLRFRPIMMTTLAALLGAVPLAIGGGEGAELRHPLGVTIVGGLIVSQILTLYTTPVIYLQLERLRQRWHARSHRVLGSTDAAR